MPRRLIQLFSGLVLYGISDGMLLLAGLGVDPWDVLHQGLARRIGLQTGTWSIIVGAAVLLLWIPLRQRPGSGTVCNVVLIGSVIDVVLAVVAPPHSVLVRVLVLAGGVVLNGVATGLYIGAGLGPGPRDGLMTGIAARGYSTRVVRTGIEAAALAAGWLLGGTVGIGTVVYAICIGPLAHIFIPLFAHKGVTLAPEQVAATASTAASPVNKKFNGGRLSSPHAWTRGLLPAQQQMPAAEPVLLPGRSQYPADFNELSTARKRGEIVDRPPECLRHLVLECRDRPACGLEEGDQQVTAGSQHPAELTEVRRQLIRRRVDDGVPGHDAAQLAVCQV